MMKKITLLLALLAVSLGYSQQTVLEDFEGTAPSTALFDGFTSATVVANPTVGAEKSLELITSATGEAWQGAKLIVQNTTIDMTTADKTMSVDIYSLTARDFLFKLVDGAVGGADLDQESKTTASHTGSGWETLALDFNVAADTSQPGYNPPNDKFGGIVFFPLYIGTTPAGGWNPAAVTTTYIDNVTGISGGIVETCNDGIMNNMETDVDCGGPNCSACPNPPAAAPTTPPNRAPADVVSIYSDAYTDETPSNLETFGGAVLSEIDFSGNSIRSVTTPVSGAGFQTQFFNPTPNLNLVDFDFMHVDFYFEGSAPTIGTVLIVNAQHLDGTNIEKFFDVTTLASNTWHEMDIPFASFEGNPGYTRDQIGQIIVNVSGTDGALVGPFYIDNLYFHKNTTLGVEDNVKLALSVYPNPSLSSWTVRTESINMSSIKVFDVLGKNVLSLTPNKTVTEIDGSSLKSGLYFAQIKTETGISSVKLIKK